MHPKAARDLIKANKTLQRILDNLVVEHERTLVTLRSIGDAVITTTTENKVDYLNAAAERVTGWSTEEARGKPIQEICVLLDDPPMEFVIDPVTRRSMPLQALRGFCNTVLRNRRGERIAVEDSVAPILDSGGNVTGTAIVLRDVQEKRAFAERLAHMARHDSLTDLPNRNLLYERIDRAVESGQEHGHPFGVLFVDLDRFNQINESQGHTVGDELLQAIGKRLKEIVRDSDTVSRQGGDEFVVLLSCLADPLDLLTVAEKIRGEISKPYAIGERKISITFSIGMALFPEHGLQPEELLQHSDAAMYRAKREGKNCCRLYSAEIDDEVIHRHAREIELRDAIDRGELRVFYQPKISARLGTVMGTEALVRWQKPDGALLAPAHFIPLAEETGLIVQLGAFVMKEACLQNKEWQKAGLPPMTVAVNISAVQLSDKDLVNTVSQSLESSGLKPEFLQLEITETTAMQDAEATLEILRELKSIGVMIAIDDFGMGYSSLSYLRRFPIDTLKIDRSFVTDVDSDDDRAIVTAMVSLAKALKMTTVAEGVETEAQARWLVSLGCDEMQGYLFARPAPACDIEEYLKSAVTPARAA